MGGKVDTYGDYRRILERKDIDVVVIATPDHWHCPMVIEACEAGKDIYLEKPVSNDIDMCLKAVAAARKYNRVVQVGLMQRSSAPFMEAYKEVQSGILGKVRHVVVINPGGSAPRGGRGGAGRGAPGGGQTTAEASSTPPPGLDWEMFQGAGAARAVQSQSPAQLAQLLGIWRRPALRLGRASPRRRALVPGRHRAIAHRGRGVWMVQPAAGRPGPGHDRSLLAVSDLRRRLQLAVGRSRHVSVGRRRHTVRQPLWLQRTAGGQPRRRRREAAV